jgi:hypothetical protein
MTGFADGAVGRMGLVCAAAAAGSRLGSLLISASTRAISPEGNLQTTYRARATPCDSRYLLRYRRCLLPSFTHAFKVFELERQGRSGLGSQSRGILDINLFRGISRWGMSVVSMIRLHGAACD